MSEFLKNAFLDNYLTRQEWGKLIGINRKTIARWETEIIQQVPPVKAQYFPLDRSIRAHYLDNYQRFLIACILVAKGGLERRSRSYESVIKFLKVNFSDLKRENFEQWVKNNV
ncbi:hypothetical protein ACX27_04080 [Nostoc piscinale CENA21]|uniref:Uncharacterized protein n=1 Tax=Nostoc piscinale CENA21 TaxID=224013 RepID=A0A0M4TU72_9NOSO|nr:hypothetical protein [Nostoc piscinale]ALF52214.1 hypothetical protein ACX27_04080 [Nostoc piscinale CENA21]